MGCPCLLISSKICYCRAPNLYWNWKRNNPPTPSPTISTPIIVAHPKKINSIRRTFFAPMNPHMNLLSQWSKDLAFEALGINISRYDDQAHLLHPQHQHSYNQMLVANSTYLRFANPKSKIENLKFVDCRVIMFRG